MMPRDEAWERCAAADHAIELRKLLENGQNIDVEMDGSFRGTLRAYLDALKESIDKALKR